jgi:hypothetical protein
MRPMARALFGSWSRRDWRASSAKLRASLTALSWTVSRTANELNCSWPVPFRLSTTKPKEGFPVKIRLLLVLAFILSAPTISSKVSGRTGFPVAYMAMGQCGGHGDTSGGCGTPTPPQASVQTALPKHDRSNPNRSGPVRNDSADFGSSLITGLTALGVGTLFWLRMR